MKHFLVWVALAACACGRTEKSPKDLDPAGIASGGSGGEGATGGSGGSGGSGGTGGWTFGEVGGFGGGGGTGGSAGSGGTGGSGGAGGSSGWGGAAGSAGAAPEEGPWQLQQELPYEGALTYFGDDVAIDGDTLLVGSIVGELGRVYVFVREGQTWSEQWRISPDSDEFLGAEFGHALAIEGDTALVGAPSGTQGRAFVIVRDGDAWSLEQELVPSEVAEGNGFGYSVALSGDTALVGAPSRNAAYVFVREGGSWTEREVFRPPPDEPEEFLVHHRFGGDVAIDGEIGFVRYVGDIDREWPCVSVRCYMRENGNWTAEDDLRFECADDAFVDVALSGDTLLVGDDAYLSWRFETWVRNDSGWEEEARIGLANPADEGFGRVVALDADTALVASTTSAENLEHSGAVYVYVRDGGAWSELQRLLSPREQEWDSFGHALAIDGNTAVVTAPGRVGEDAFGSVYVYTLQAND